MLTDNNRLIELETRIAFQDETLAELNVALYQQQIQMLALQEKLNYLIEASRKNQDESASSSNTAFEIPPHY